MNPEGVARFFTLGMMRDGPFPEHYEPFEAPVSNALHPQINANPVARVFKRDLEVFGRADDYPYVATTYRLTELFHFWAKHCTSTQHCSPSNSSRLARHSLRRRASTTAIR